MEKKRKKCLNFSLLIKYKMKNTVFFIRKFVNIKYFFNPRKRFRFYQYNYNVKKLRN